MQSSLMGGHSHYGGDVDVKLQRPTIFSAAVTQWPRIFADCLCCHPKTPHFWWNVGSSITLIQRTVFLHSAATGSYFLFQFHRQIDNFCHFRQFFFFFQIPAFKALTEMWAIHPYPFDIGVPSLGLIPTLCMLNQKLMISSLLEGIFKFSFFICKLAITFYMINEIQPKRKFWNITIPLQSCILF